MAALGSYPHVFHAKKERGSRASTGKCPATPAL
jgi:hypothetical protein